MSLVAMALMVVGAAFLLIAAIGVVRLADPLQRMHSATKAGTLGIALLLLGVRLSGWVETGSTVLLTILFLLVTLPIGAQLLGRAAYVSGARLKGLDADPIADSGELAKIDQLLEREP